MVQEGCQRGRGHWSRSAVARWNTGHMFSKRMTRRALPGSKTEGTRSSEKVIGQADHDGLL